MTAAAAKSGRRFEKHHEIGNPSTLAPDHPAAAEGRTRYRKTVRPASSALHVLKSGDNSSKIGGRITKGRWAGMPVFTLTLEERATCPRTCQHWLNCYGNKMHWAHRFEMGRELENALVDEIGQQSLKHPAGFVVRLHILGDFYSVEYVNLWRRLLKYHAPLRVYGYTAWPVTTPIGRAVQRLRDENWDRFSVRTSDGALHDAATISDTRDRRADHETGTVCPMQLQQTDCCATCGLCWQTRDNIIFLEH